MDSAHQIHDVEAVPPLPEELESSAIGERPRSSFLSRRKKTIAVVVSVVLVVGIAVGVALAVTPSNTVSQSNQDVGVVNDPLEESPGNQDVGIANDPLEESPAADSDESVADIDESVADSVKPQVEEFFENEDVDVIIDVGQDAEYPDDIIIDVGHDAEYPDDTIYNEGYYQDEPEVQLFLPEEESTVEKFPLESDDEDIEIAEFDGPLSDFIVSDLSRISNVSSKDKCLEAGQALWSLSFTTDRYPWENPWSLVDSDDNVITSGPPEGKNYERVTSYYGQMCLEPGKYTMKLSDKSKDGFCCTYGKGKMIVKVDGNTEVSTNEGKFAEKRWSFTVDPSLQPSIITTAKPTKRPTKRPTKSPTPLPTADANQSVPDGQHAVNIKMLTDRFGSETGFSLSNPKGRVILERKKGELTKDTSYNIRLVLDPGLYTLKIEDSFQGIQEKGYYSVLVDDEEVLQGSTFFTPSVSHGINVGYKPPMTAREQEWLDAHNSRRKEYHEGEGKPYNKLVWSPDLARKSDFWVDMITPTCKIVRQQGQTDGENISVRSAGGERDEGPEKILTRWANNKKNSGYPQNQSMTQVLWRSTRYVGCSEKVVKRSGGTNPNSMCYVTVCRYSRPANCAMGQFSTWEEPTLADRSKCGDSCPDNVCY